MDAGVSSSSVEEKKWITLDEFLRLDINRERLNIPVEEKKVITLDEPVREEALRRFRKLKICGLTVEEEKEPHKNPTPRFQLFSAKVHVDKYGASNTKLYLHGYITISDMSALSEKYVWLPEDKDADPNYDPDWCEHVRVQMCDPEYGYAILFYREWSELLPIVNNGYINSLNHPSTDHSIPFDNFLHIISEVYLYNKEDKLFFDVSNENKPIYLSDQRYDTLCTHIMKGDHGSVEFSYIVLRDSSDAALEIKCRMLKSAKFGDPVSVKIIGYYGGENDCGSGRNEGCNVTLLDSDTVAMVKDNKISLNTSLMAVPINGSLLIHAFIKDTSGLVIMDDYCEFHAKLNGSSNGHIKAADCCLEVLVNWKYEAAP